MRPQLLEELWKGSGQPQISWMCRPERWLHCATDFSSCCRCTGEIGWERNSRQEARV